MGRAQQHVLDAVRRASLRSTTVVYLDLKRGLTSLACIAVTATFVGVLGTLYQIALIFSGEVGSKDGLFPIYARLLSEALVPAALGLATSLISFGSHRYL